MAAFWMGSGMPLEPYITHKRALHYPRKRPTRACAELRYAKTSPKPSRQETLEPPATLGAADEAASRAAGTSAPHATRKAASFSFVTAVGAGFCMMTVYLYMHIYVYICIYAVIGRRRLLHDDCTVMPSGCRV